MDRRLKILISLSTCLPSDEVAGLFSRNCFSVEICEPNGLSMLEAMENNDIDVVLTDVFIVGIDAINLKNRYDVFSSRPVKFFGVLPESSRCVESLLLREGFSYYFINPDSAQLIFDTVSNILTIPVIDESDSLELEMLVSDCLKNLAVSPDFQGYSCLKSAIEMYTTDGTSQISITKEIYPAIAKKSRLSPPCVEKIIRNVIESSWKNASIESQQYYFGYSRTEKKRPTNLKFVATIANHLWLEQKRLNNSSNLSFYA